MLTDKKAKEIFDYYGVKENVEGVSTIVINNSEKKLDDELVQNIFKDMGFFDDINDDATEIKYVIDIEINTIKKTYENSDINDNYCMAA